MKNRPPGVRWMRALLLVLFIGTGLQFATTNSALADGTWLPQNFSTLGERIDSLWGMIFVLTAVIFFITEGALLWFIIRYRARPGRKAKYFPDHLGLEVTWSVVPGLILLFLAIYQWNTWADAKLRVPDQTDAVRVQILAQQFEWNVRYPGPDDLFGTDDDLTLKNQLYIPEGKTILAQMRALDVIHSFFLPNFRVKQDLVPGITVQVWWDSNTTGNFEIACSELCGLGHYRMRARMVIYTQEEYESWLQEKYDAGVKPADWGWDWEEGV